MFSGIVTDIGTIRSVHGTDERELEVAPGFAASDLAIGASVAHSGICLTVTGRTAGAYRVHASGETLAHTTLGRWRPGDLVNLERSLRLGDELGGHLVFGHVDGVGEIEDISARGDARRIGIRLPEALAQMVAVKGSIAVDGVSLTVTETLDDLFAVAVIPHTWSHTTLSSRRVGDPVNIEVDMLARYVSRQLALRAGAQS